MRLLVVILLFLTGCWDTINLTNNAISAVSDPITISPLYGNHDKIYMTLIRSGPNIYTIRFQWTGENNTKQFDENSIIKFLINNRELITLEPTSLPKTISVNEKNRTITEVCDYQTSFNTFNKIAKARSAELEINGKHKIIISHFNLLHTINAFKTFMKKSH